LSLADVECSAWKTHLGLQSGNISADERVAGLLAVVDRHARQALAKMTEEKWLLDVGWNLLLLAKVSWLSYLAGLRGSTANDLLGADEGITKVRQSGSTGILPQALLIRACLRFLTGARTGPESAQADLDEAWEIAERGPMKLFLADIHLHRARLFFREKEYPKQWISPQADLAAARKLIEQCGYWRRKEELEDAEKVIGV
jgi:hypothetical protein